MTSLVERLRRVKYFRTEWLEPHGEVDMPVFPDMASDDGVFTSPVNPDGPDAAAVIEILADALSGVMDILGRAESNASGNPEWDYVGPRVASARAALERVS
jgi:hypothetical protein